MVKQDKKAKNRAVLLAVAGIMIALFVMINARTFVFASGIYVVMGIVVIFLYLNWNKIQPIG